MRNQSFISKSFRSNLIPMKPKNLARQRFCCMQKSPPKNYPPQFYLARSFNKSPLCIYHFCRNTTRSHKGYLFLFYPTVQIIFVFSKSTDAHPRQDVLPDKFWREYIYRNKNGWLNCYDWKCIWVLVSIRSSIRLF